MTHPVDIDALLESLPASGVYVAHAGAPVLWAEIRERSLDHWETEILLSEDGSRSLKRGILDNHASREQAAWLVTGDLHYCRVHERFGAIDTPPTARTP